MNHPSRFADVDAAQAAVSLALPTIERILQCVGVSACKVMHLVVLDPALSCGSCRFEEAVLYEQSVGDRARWDADYGSFAREKARLSWRHRMDSRRLVQLAPHLLQAQDALLWGGVWLDGIVVAASGARPPWDEACSLLVAGNLRAIALERSAGMPIATVNHDNPGRP